MRSVQTPGSRHAGLAPAVCLALAAAAGLGAGIAQAAPWPDDNLVLEVPVEVVRYKRVVRGEFLTANLAVVPVEVRCTVYRGASAVRSGSARASMRNETPLPSMEEVTAGITSSLPSIGSGGSVSGGRTTSPPVVYYSPLREVLRVRLRGVRGVDRYRCELFIDGRKRCGSGQTCEVRGELPARVTGPAARAAGEAARRGARGLGGTRGGGGFLPGR